MKFNLKRIFNNPEVRKRAAIGVLLLAGMAYLYKDELFNQDSVDPPQKLTYTEFQNNIKTHNINAIKINENGTRVKGILEDSKHEFFAYIPTNRDITLDAGAVDVEVVENESSGISFGALVNLLFIGMIYYQIRTARRHMGAGKSKAKVQIEPNTGVKFSDVAGIDETKQEMMEIIDFLKRPDHYKKLGAKIPKGILMVGPPGTGKTLMARALAGEAGVPFISISGSDFVEMFVGVGAARVRDLFEQARKNAPCIIFIDEIDGIGKHRGNGSIGGHDEREQALNQLLVELDGFEKNSGIILIGATNRAEILDPALLRPGRLDRKVYVPLPDVKGREQILNVHITKVKVIADINPKVIAQMTPGFSGADLENLVNEAAIMAARRGSNTVGMDDFESARDKILMGVERKTLAMSPEEKKLTAYHEAGHALVSLYEPHSDPIHKATVIPRGDAAGMVVRMPGENVIPSKGKFLADLSVAMGGRAAEEIIYGEDGITAGAASDIEQATHIATAMVTRWGFSSDIGMRSFTNRVGSVEDAFQVSEATAEKIDIAINGLINDAYNKAKKILINHRDQLELLTSTLLQKETMSREEILKLLNMDSKNPAAQLTPNI